MAIKRLGATWEHISANAGSGIAPRLGNPQKRPTKPGFSERRRELARIHILAGEVGLDEGAYRDMLWTVARVRSAAELDEYGRRRVIEHLQSRLPWPDNGPRPRSIGEIAGLRLALRAAERRAKGIPATLEQRPMLKKIGAQLADARRPWKYRQALAQRIAHKDRLELCSDAELRKIVAALAIDQQRRARRAEASA